MPDSDNRRAHIRYAIFLAATTLSILFVLWSVSDALLLIFAGVVFAAFLDAMTVLLGRVFPWTRGVRLAVVSSLLAAGVTAAILWGGTAIAVQGSELATTLGAQINRVLSWLNQHGIEVSPNSIGALTDRASPSSRGAAPTLKSILPDVGGLFGPAWAAIATILGGLGDALVIVFLGLFLAAQPCVYRDTLLLLAPPACQSRFRDVLDECGETLRHWLIGQSLTMLSIGVFVWIGLLLVDVGPAVLLGLQAGLLAFVPTLGPLVAGIAVVLAGLSFGLWPMIGALAVYVTAQTLESYILTPMIQRRAIAVPPAFLFMTQIALGVTFGLYGLALATPLAAIARVLILRLYVDTWAVR